VLLEGYTPPALYPPEDADPINRARVESASEPTFGTPTVIEPLFALDLTGATPATPRTYNFTTSAEPAGEWVRVVWVTVAGSDYPTVPYWMPVLSPYAPGVGDVAAKVRLLLRESGGALAVNFTDGTIPTAQQVQGMIAQDFPLVLIRTGDLAALDCPTSGDIRGAVKSIAAERVALQVLEVYHAEEAEAGQYGLDRRRDALQADLEAVVSAAAECRAGEVVPEDLDNPDPDEVGGGSGVAMDPEWSFPRVPYLNW
jgi:hypothetical protein